MKTSRILGLGAACAIGAGLGCAALIGLDPADPQPACINAADQTALGQQQLTFVDDVLACTVTVPNGGDLGAASACIQGKDGGISNPCIDCFAADGACVSQSCGEPCSNGSGSNLCQVCIASMCNPTLIACGGMPIYACVDPPNRMALALHAGTFQNDVQMCGGAHPNDENGEIACIHDMDGLSPSCALCYAQLGLCAANYCQLCVHDPTSVACSNCVDGACTPAFTLCSGPMDGGGPG